MYEKMTLKSTFSHLLMLKKNKLECMTAQVFFKYTLSQDIPEWGSQYSAKVQIHGHSTHTGLICKKLTGDKHSSLSRSSICGVEKKVYSVTIRD